MKTRLIPLPLTVASACFASVLHAAEISGPWKAAFDSQVGKQSYVNGLKADGDIATEELVTTRVGAAPTSGNAPAAQEPCPRRKMALYPFTQPAFQPAAKRSMKNSDFNSITP